MQDHSSQHESNEPLRTSFTDNELDAALTNFEREFEEQHGHVADEPSNTSDYGQPSEENQDDVLGEFEKQSFAETLDELTGSKAKAAVVFSPLPYQAIASICFMLNISAVCVPAEFDVSAVILRNLDGGSPEASAKKISKELRAVSIAFLVNRADKLTSQVYVEGDLDKNEETPAPPMLLSFATRPIEDVILGIGTIEELMQSSSEYVDVDKLTIETAMGMLYDDNGDNDDK